jgi:hypothetical protein
MKVIFLDIDGVLNCSRTPNPRRFPYIVDPVLLGRYLHLVARTNARTVLLSTWRHDPAGRWSARYYGLPFTDVIPDMPDASRRVEIEAYLGEHPEVTRFAVLDDEDDSLDGLPLFQPSSRAGLTGEMVRAIIAYLNGETEHCMKRSWFIRSCQNIRTWFRRRES